MKPSGRPRGRPGEAQGRPGEAQGSPGEALGPQGTPSERPDAQGGAETYKTTTDERIKRHTLPQTDRDAASSAKQDFI